MRRPASGTARSTSFTVEVSNDDWARSRAGLAAYMSTAVIGNNRMRLAGDFRERADGF